MVFFFGVCAHLHRKRRRKLPGGSPSGQAIGVSAGYAPVSTGTDTSGSLIMPATRAALYTIRGALTALVSQHQVAPISPSLGSIGPMTKSVADLVNLLNVLIGSATDSSSSQLQINLTGKWDDLTIATVDPLEWKAAPEEGWPVLEATKQMVCLRVLSSRRILTLGIGAQSQ